MLFDAHCHINDDSWDEASLAELDSGIREGELTYVVDAGTTVEDSTLAVRDTERWPWCYAAVGIYPHETGGMTEETIEEIKKLAAEEKVRAIGEIGLDYHYDDVDKDTQKHWFARQIQMACELGMPIVIHSRDANKDTMDILKENGAFSDERKSMFPKRPGPGGVMVPDSRVLIHCYSYSVETAEEYVRLGAAISICGPVTFKNNRKTRQVVEAVPLEFLTVETDSPYLAPEPVRGRRNTPLNVKYTAAKVAEIKGVPYEEAADTTFANACRFYGINGAGGGADGADGRTGRDQGRAVMNGSERGEK
jgi:TatD DNase family protein